MMDDAYVDWMKGKGSVDERFSSVLRHTKTMNFDSVDALAKKSTQEAYQQIDCLKCGNCCRTTPTIFTNEDVARISKYLVISKKTFLQKYTITDSDGSLTSIGVPCPFLQSDNSCKVYEVAPSACKSYPHTDKSRFATRTNSYLANAKICPITFKVLSDLEEKLKG